MCLCAQNITTYCNCDFVIAIAHKLNANDIFFMWLTLMIYKNKRKKKTEKKQNERRRNFALLLTFTYISMCTICYVSHRVWMVWMYMCYAI